MEPLHYFLEKTAFFSTAPDYPKRDIVVYTNSRIAVSAYREYCYDIYQINFPALESK